MIRFGGEKCACGRRGCFEAYASATALIRQTRRAREKDRQSKLWDMCGGDIANVNGKTAFDGSRAGDITAKKVVNAYIRYLSEGIANIVNAFRPEAILLGGGISREGKILIEPLKRKVRDLAFGKFIYSPVEMLVAKMGNLAGIVGAALLAKT